MHFPANPTTMGSMGIRLVLFKILAGALVLGLIAWIGLEIYRGAYLQAVAISGVSSLLLWFALGMANRSADDD